ncbi:endolysin [Pseudomonas phage vB_PpuP-Villemi]
MQRTACNLRLAEQASKSDRGAGLKFDGGKGRWSLMMQGCAAALAGVVEVLGFGAKKYAAHSWKQVENGEERYRDALYRHLHAIERGEEVDPESGLPHWDHLCCNALFLSTKYHESK